MKVDDGLAGVVAGGGILLTCHGMPSKPLRAARRRRVKAQ
jgi:hypothetical protein